MTPYTSSSAHPNPTAPMNPYTSSSSHPDPTAPHEPLHLLIITPTNFVVLSNTLDALKDGWRPTVPLAKQGAATVRRSCSPVALPWAGRPPSPPPPEEHPLEGNRRPVDPVRAVSFEKIAARPTGSEIFPGNLTPME